MLRLLPVLSILILALCHGATPEAVAQGASPALSPTSPPSKRVALVIGNAAYTHTGPLANPANDAKLMAQTLQHRQATQCPWIQAAGTREHRSNGPETVNALTMNADHFVAAGHLQKNNALEISP